jgi:hypothetical protein
MHKGKLYDLYFSPSINSVRTSNMMRQKAYKGMERNADGVLVGKPEGMRPLGRSRCRREDIIKISLTEVAWKGVN